MEGSQGFEQASKQLGMLHITMNHNDACAIAAVAKSPANKFSAKDVMATSAETAAVLISMPSCHRSVLQV